MKVIVGDYKNPLNNNYLTYVCDHIEFRDGKLCLMQGRYEVAIFEITDTLTVTSKKSNNRLNRNLKEATRISEYKNASHSN